MNATQVSARQVRIDLDFDRLKERLIETTGLAYYRDKDDELAARIATRLNAKQVPDCGRYLSQLGEDAAGQVELDALTASLTIGETFFFRHRELFDALRERVLPELIERNREHRRLRIWSAGCATGAEPYSLAILLGREFSPWLAGWEVSILGTDINREFLAEAQRGVFGEWSFRAAPEGLKETCFERTCQGWKLRETYRRDVSFQYHNLVEHPFPSLVNNLSAFDLVLCRNVMIYFDAAIVSRLVGKFHDSLVDGGWLAVGHAEPNVEIYRAFRTVNSPGAVLYQKGGHPTPTFDWAPPVDLPLDASRPLGSTPQRMLAVGRLKPTETADRQRSQEVASFVTLAEIRAQLNRGDWEAAAAGCRELATVERLNPLLHFYHALVTEQLGERAESERALRRAVYLDRGFVLAHYYLGLVLQRNHDFAAAERSFRNVLSLSSGRNEADSFPDADGLTVGALVQLSQMHLDVLQRT